MADIPSGKGIFIWNLSDVGFGVNMPGLVSFLKGEGISHVTVKILQSTWKTWGFEPSNKDLLPAFVAECRKHDIQVGGYQYVVGFSKTHAAAEGEVANDYVLALGLDFFVVDAEHQYKVPEAGTWVNPYMGQLTMPVPVGLCSYRFPSVHPEFPWSVWLNVISGIDFHMPQVYWAGTSSPTAGSSQLAQSYNELMAIRPLPFVPVGAAYCEGGWCSSPAQVKVFAEAAQAMGLTGISFWDMRHAYLLHPELGDAIRDAWVPVDPVEPPPDPDPGVVMGTVTAALNLREYPVVASCTLIRTMPAGERVNIIGKRNDYCGWDWYEVVDAGGLDGWCSQHRVVLDE